MLGDRIELFLNRVVFDAQRGELTGNTLDELGNTAVRRRVDEGLEANAQLLQAREQRIILGLHPAEVTSIGTCRWAVEGLQRLNGMPGGVKHSFPHLLVGFRNVERVSPPLAGTDHIENVA